MEGQEEGRARGGKRERRKEGRERDRGEGETGERVRQGRGRNRREGETGEREEYIHRFLVQPNGHIYNTHLPFPIRFLTAGTAQEGSTVQVRVNFGVGSMRFL